MSRVGQVIEKKWLASGLAVLLLGVATLQAQTADKAEELYKRTEYKKSLAALPSSSDDADVNNLKGRDYYMMGDFSKAVNYFQKAVDTQPDSSDFALWLGRGWGRRAETANPFMAPGYASKARQWMEKAVDLDPKNREALSDLFDYYLEAPGFLGGGYDKAQRVAGMIATIDPAEGHFARARLAEKHSEYTTAEAQLRRAMEAAPKQAGRIVDLAKFLAKQGRQQESDAVFEKAQNLFPENPTVWYARADTLIRQKRNLPEAKMLLEKYLQSSLTPDNPSRDEAQRLLKKASGGA